MWKYIIYFDEYVIHFHTGQPQVTATYLADGMLANITAAGATAAWNIANFVLHGCKLTHAEADLHRVGNLGNEAGIMHALNSGPVFNGGPANAEVATTQSFHSPKKARIKSKKAALKPILGRINAPRLPNWQYKKLQPPVLPVRCHSEVASPRTSSTAVVAT